MYLIVGAGFLGTYLIRYLSSHTEEPILAAVRDPAAAAPFPHTEYIRCDITDGEDVRRLTEACGGEKLTVFYFAACHNVDYLFEHPLAAREVNIRALLRFLDTVPEIEKFFFASTDCVYGENAPGSFPFKETDACRPVNEYGRQKLEAEALVRGRGFTAVRFAYMLGPSLLPKRHFYDAIAEKLAAGEPVEMIDGMVRSALSYETAASLLARLSFLPAAALPDTVNLCSDGEYTKYELGRRIAERVGAPETLVRPIPESEARFFKDRRASRLVMDNTRLKTLLGISEIRLEV